MSSNRKKKGTKATKHVALESKISTGDTTVDVTDITIDVEDMMQELGNTKSGISKYTKLAKSMGIDLTEFIPKHKKYYLKFHLRRTNSGLANAIRRGICSEYKCLSMIANYKQDITSDDVYIKVDEVRKHIEAIPFQQDDLPPLEYMQKNWKISLDYTNESSTIKVIHSSDIHIHDSHTKTDIDVGDLFEGMIPIASLKPGRYLKAIITLAVGRGETNGNAFKACGAWNYCDMNADDGKHILSYEPNHFSMGYQTYGNCKNPTHIIRCICEDLIARVTKYANVIAEFPQTYEDQITDDVQFTNIGSMYKYTFMNENRTITNMFSDYGRAISPEDFNVSGYDHPSQPTSFVKIKHSQPHVIMVDASKKILKDLNIILEFFNNYKWKP